MLGDSIFASLVTVAAGKFARYKVVLLGVQEVRSDNEGPLKARDYNYFFGKRNENYHFRTFFCTAQNNSSI